jgi:RNase P/RNase MRP subunit p30|tara:strand:- start:596 stop:1036 length:441 start_codon:yes stop_codon:yes gene_type:complete
MINNNDLVKVRNEIKRLVSANEEVVVRAGSDEFNRKVFEMRDVGMVVGLEFGKRDRLKQRDSGLNEIMCRLAKKNGIVVGVDVGRLARLDKLEKAKVLARVRQNIGLCKRTGVKMIGYPAGDYDKKDLSGLVVSLGGSSGQGKMAG